MEDERLQLPAALVLPPGSTGGGFNLGIDQARVVKLDGGVNFAEVHRELPEP